VSSSLPSTIVDMLSSQNLVFVLRLSFTCM